MINFDADLIITNVTDLTKEITFYEYGPLLSLWELDEFVSKLVEKQSVLKNFKNELFFFLYHIIVNSANRSIDQSILAFKFPYCFLLKFGSLEEIKYVLHFDNRMYYNLESKNGTKYEESYYLTARLHWGDLMKEREREFTNIQIYQYNKVRDAIVSNQNALTSETVAFMKNIDRNMLSQTEAQKEIAELDKKIKESAEKRDEGLNNLVAGLSETVGNNHKSDTTKKSVNVN